VWSALVSLRPPGAREALQVGDEAAFLSFLKGCFAQKRKTLRNNLRALVQPASAAQEILRESGIPADARAEELTLAEFARVFTACTRRNSRRN
jgi:16S rRNA (adenine1518-N6/adenine1519-N6)-dimethyltransferase